MNLEYKLLKIAGSLEKLSEHPLAEAIMKKVNEEKIDLEEVTEFEAVSGRGVKGKILGEIYYGGNLSFMEDNGVNTEYYIDEAEKQTKEGKTILFFSNNKKIIGLIAVADIIKENSKKAVEELKNKNIEVVMLTGDNKNVAENIAKQVGIDKFISDVMPQDKEKEVQKLQNNNKKVAFVGDGINDSPALARADIGIAIGSGTDIAIESADVVLIKDDLYDVVTSIDLSKKVINNIKLSLFWAFIYNIIGIPIACRNSVS